MRGHCHTPSSPTATLTVIPKNCRRARAITETGRAMGRRYTQPPWTKQLRARDTLAPVLYGDIKTSSRVVTESGILRAPAVVTRAGVLEYDASALDLFRFSSTWRVFL